MLWRSNSGEVISCNCRGKSAYTDAGRNKQKEHRSTGQERGFNTQKKEGNCEIGSLNVQEGNT